jgi:hypothetical protein
MNTSRPRRACDPGRDVSCLKQQRWKTWSHSPTRLVPKAGQSYTSHARTPVRHNLRNSIVCSIVASSNCWTCILETKEALERSVREKKVTMTMTTRSKDNERIHASGSYRNEKKSSVTGAEVRAKCCTRGSHVSLSQLRVPISKHTLHGPLIVQFMVSKRVPTREPLRSVDTLSIICLTIHCLKIDLLYMLYTTSWESRESMIVLDQ